ncbi:MAG: SDR family NAD(P)-dependent oxidoreductase [Pseudomonadota bacterium]
MQDLKDKVAVITGGASGIGFNTASRLADRGAHLVLTDIEANALDQAVESLKPKGIKVEGVVCDVSKFDQMQQLADTTFERMGAAHIVFNNAGIAVGGPILDMTHADWEWTIQVDLWGPIHGVEVFASRIAEQGEGGHILFTSSFAGLVPNEGLCPYCVAKYGVVALAEVLRRELRGHDIGVSVLCPMRVATNIGNSERNRQTEFGGAETSPPLPEQDSDNRDLAGRVLDVGDVADMVVNAITENQLYILPHEESREFIRRRFERIDRTFE